MRCNVVLTLITAIMVLPAAAQLTRGSVAGAIEDAAGAFVEDVRITAVNRQTGIRFLTRTNDAGVYRFAALDAGVYELEYAKDGFQSLRIEGIEVGAARDIVLNRSLSVAPVATDVTVIASANGIELAKSGPTIDRRYGRHLIENLPLAGLSPSGDHRDLMLLAPTAVRVQEHIATHRISVNGQRRNGTNSLMDGADNNEFFLGFPAQFPAREEIAEVQVQTSAYSAEFGRNTAQFSILTRSGTNQFHGEAWDYYTGSALSAMSLADKRAGLDNPRSTQNFVGAAVGGPAIRNRTFFYAIAHANLKRDGFNVRTATPIRIPTAAGFQALTSVPLGPGQSSESRRAILNALSFLPQLHREIRFYDNVQSIIVNGVPIETGTVRIPFANAVDTPSISLRLDHQLTPKDTVTVRVRGTQQFTPNTSLFATNLNFGDRFSTAQYFRARNYAFSHARIFSPRWTNEARAGYNFVEIDYRVMSSETNILVKPLFMLGPHFLAPSRTLTSTTQFQDVASLLSGRHSWKTGIDVRSMRFFQVLANAQRGAWLFLGFPEFMNNQAAQLGQFAGTPGFGKRFPALHAFVQDDVKLTPKFTLNLGLRYEITSVPFGFFGAATPEIAALGVPAPVRPDRNNWAPRAGFAWSLTDTTVLRGGFGIAYNTLFEHIIDTRSNYPRAQVLVTGSPQTFQSFPRLNPTPVADLGLAAFTNLPTNAQQPTTHFYSFSAQREFGAYIVEAGYSGARAYHLVRRFDANPGTLSEEQASRTMAGAAIPPLQQRRVNPDWGARGIVEPAASSYYNAVFLRADRRLAQGLMLGANFTYSSNFTENDDEPPQLYSCFRCDYARSNFDRPMRFVIHYLYQLPAFRGSRPLRHITSGWQLAGFAEWQSGQPFNIFTGVDSAGSGVEMLPVGAPNLFPSFTARPDYNPGGSYVRDPVTGDWRSFTVPRDNSGLFVSPRRADGSPLANSMPRGGNLGRNVFRGPMFWNWNLSLMKTVDISERLKVQVRGEWMNLFNHRNFGPPVSDMNSLDFGRNLSAPPGRVIQLIAKLRF